MLLFGYEISRNTIQIQKQNREKRKRKLWRYQKYVFFLPPQKYNYCRDWKNFKCIFSLSDSAHIYGVVTLKETNKCIKLI